MKKKHIYDYTEELKGNILFKLSLGSKELFHSNFLESILSGNEQEMKDFSKSFFEIIGVNSLPDKFELFSKREQNNTDIIFYFYPAGNTDSNPKSLIKAVVIENKVKSIPDKDQLIKYKGNFESKRNYDESKYKYFLLSLLNSEFELKDIGWERISYSDLSDHLKNALNKNSEKLNKLDSESNVSQGNGSKVSLVGLINEYISFTKDLDILGQAIKNTEQGDLYDFVDGVYQDANFKEIRLHDLMFKIKYREILRQLESKIKELDENIDIKELNKKERVNGGAIIYTGTGFSNGCGLLDFRIPIGFVPFESKEIPVFLGAQLQKDQLRYFSYIHKGESGLTDAVIKEIHKSIIPGIKKEWFENDILTNDFKEKGLNWGRKGEGRAEPNKSQTAKNNAPKEKPGYCKFDDEFYFKYDIIVKYNSEKGKKNLIIKNNSQTKITDILEFFKKLVYHIWQNRENIQNQINGKNPGDFQIKNFN